MGYFSVEPDRWKDYLDISDTDIPGKVIIEGRMDYPGAIEKRSLSIEDVRPGWMPNLVLGSYKGALVAYAACFGGPIASQIAHIYCNLGTEKVVQIGTCGGLQENIDLGDIVVSQGVLSLDGCARLYKRPEDFVAFDPSLLEKASRLLDRRDVQVYVGRTVSIYDILLEEIEDLFDLSRSGYVAIEMEAGAIGAVAGHFGTPALSMFVVSDNSISDKGLFYERTEDEQERITRGLDTLFGTALDL